RGPAEVLGDVVNPGLEGRLDAWKDERYAPAVGEESTGGEEDAVTASPRLGSLNGHPRGVDSPTRRVDDREPPTSGPERGRRVRESAEQRLLRVRREDENARIDGSGRRTGPPAPPIPGEVCS